jgi:dTDP-4-amino-4,6-dideoxygalactose transaminase
MDILKENAMSNMKPIRVTQPLLPPLDEFISYLKDIWDKKWITNDGYYHKKLEKALVEYLKVPYISLFTNGTLPLLVALQALHITGEVITTPYSFVATTHALWWNGLTPVFVDIEERTGNIDPDKIEAAITPKTTAIMPVHVYGNPCKTDEIQKIASKYGLKVIYDAAHAFGVEIDKTSILTKGDISTLSFHATKTYNTIEGGALVCHDAELKNKVDQLKNFGIVDETTVTMPGINGKMDEIRAAYGLLNLKYVDMAIQKRKNIIYQYKQLIQETPGVTYIEETPNVKYNYSYFPIFVDKEKYGISRDDLYEKLKSQNVFTRKYFYPLITAFSPYCNLNSASDKHLPIANKLANNVICLPVHSDLTNDEIYYIIKIVKEKE